MLFHHGEDGKDAIGVSYALVHIIEYNVLTITLWKQPCLEYDGNKANVVDVCFNILVKKINYHIEVIIMQKQPLLKRIQGGLRRGTSTLHPLGWGHKFEVTKLENW